MFDLPNFTNSSILLISIHHLSEFSASGGRVWVQHSKISTQSGHAFFHSILCGSLWSIPMTFNRIQHSKVNLMFLRVKCRKPLLCNNLMKSNTESVTFRDKIDSFALHERWHLICKHCITELWNVQEKPEIHNRTSENILKAWDYDDWLRKALIVLQP